MNEIHDYQKEVVENAKSMLKAFNNIGEESKKKTVLVCGTSPSYGKIQIIEKILKTKGFNVVLSPQRSKKLLFDIESFCHKPSDDMVDSVAYFVEGIENHGKAILKALPPTATRPILLNGKELRLCTDEFVTPLDGRSIGEQMKGVVLGLSATPCRDQKEEPKKVKFHNNLRQKLNTGGIKWAK